MLFFNAYFYLTPVFREEPFKKLLAGRRLRPGITEELAYQWSEAVVNGYHLTFRRQGEPGEDFEAALDRHEREGRKWIDMMLFGIAEKGD